MKRLVVSNLGQGSAFGKKGENNRLGRKKNRRGSEPREGKASEASLRREKGDPFPFPRPPLGSLRFPI